MEQLNIRTLLEQKRVVPEIQREYVWGDNSEIVIQFLNTLNDAFPGSANVGFLYSYESDNEYHLIDGQQRLTTIVLLALYCAKTQFNDSDVDPNFEIEYQRILNHFSYRVRSSTDNFLKSLIANNINGYSEETMKSLRFYHEYYRNDRSIQSIIKCLEVINTFKKNQADAFHITLDWIFDNVYFWKFDVEKTTQGEELYISMNSRGENLTAAEQIKPKLFEEARAKKISSYTKKSWGKLWDNWEDIFFEGCHDVKAVNKALDRLIIITLELKTKSRHIDISPVEDSKLISLIDVEKCADAYSHLFISHKEEMKYIFENDFSEYHKQILQCAIASYMHCGESQEIDRAIHFVNNWAQLGFLKSNHNAYLDFLSSFISSDTKSFYNFCLEQKDKTIGKINTEHELRKISLCADKNISSEIEPILMHIDDLYASGRDLRCVWREVFSEDFSWDKATVETFRRRAELFESIFNVETIKIRTGKNSEEGRIDNKLITRALLTIGNYHIWSSASNYAFGHYDGSKWPEIMRKHPDVISAFIDKLMTFGEIPVYDRLNRIIKESLDNKQFLLDDARYYILKYPESLRPPYEGHNILYMQNSQDWGNFNICVYSHMDGRGVGSYSQLFDAIVSRELCVEEFDNLSLSYSKVGLGVYCSPIRGWDVVWSHDFSGNLCELKAMLINKFGDRVRDDEWTRKRNRFYIPLLEGEDQIELGKLIAQDILKFGKTISIK